MSPVRSRFGTRRDVGRKSRLRKREDRLLIFIGGLESGVRVPAVKLPFLLVAAFLVLQPVFAQNVEPLKQVLAKQKELRSVKVKFRQTKEAPALADPIKTMGQLWLVPGKAFRWELGTPKKKTVVFNGQKVFVMDEVNKTGEKLDPDDRKIKPLLLTLGIGKEASYEGLNKMFTITSTNQDAERYVAVMVPQSRRIRNAIKSMLMQVNLSTSFPERIGWTQKDGTKSMTEFFKPTLNGPMEASLFQVNEAGYQWKR